MFYMCVIKGVCESVGLGPHIHMKSWGFVRELTGGVWFVKIGGGTNGKCMVCMRNGVETRFVMARDKTNG
jgi:hypothetical protein